MSSIMAINGKFFSGLTDKMMNRTSNRPDRQRTNLYWPEEEDSIPANEYNHANRTPRMSSSRTSSISYDSQGSNNVWENDVNTRDLVKKQQQSNIQFYDYDDEFVPASRKITPSSTANNLPMDVPSQVNRKLQTLKSRIEFYDFVDDANAGPKSRSAQSHLHDNSRESESAPRLDINNSHHNYHTSAADTPPSPDGQRSSTRNGRHQSTTTTHHRIEIEQEPDRNEREAAVHHKIAMDSPDGRGRERQSSVKKHLSSSVIDLSKLDLSDSELDELKRLRRPTKDEIDKKLSSFETTIKATASNTSNGRTTITGANHRSNAVRHDNGGWSPPASEHGHERVEHQQQHILRNGDPMRHQAATPTPPSRSAAVNVDDSSPNEARRNAHRHLKSSFSFNNYDHDDNGGSSTTANGRSDLQQRRPYSIRESAVGRVGVGLPDL